MSISGVNAAQQSQAFGELVNKPQAAYANPPILTMNGQPEADVYEGTQQEEKKGSFLGTVFKTLLFAGATIGLNRYAHSKGWLKPVEKDATGFMEKYVKKPLNKLDEIVLEKYNKWFKKGEAPKTDGSTPETTPAK